LRTSPSDVLRFFSVRPPYPELIFHSRTREARPDGELETVFADCQLSRVRKTVAARRAPKIAPGGQFLPRRSTVDSRRAGGCAQRFFPACPGSARSRPASPANRPPRCDPSRGDTRWTGRGGGRGRGIPFQGNWSAIARAAIATTRA